MNEILSRVHLSLRQIAAVAAFLVVAAVTQMCIPSLLSVMIDKGVGSGGAGMVVGIAVAMVALAARQVRQNLKESMDDATMIVVAQRVNTIRDATRILVLENGAVAGMGTHRELLETCKLYREIAEIQLGEKEVAAEIAGGT